MRGIFNKIAILIGVLGTLTLGIRCGSSDIKISKDIISNDVKDKEESRVIKGFINTDMFNYFKAIKEDTHGSDIRRMAENMIEKNDNIQFEDKDFMDEGYSDYKLINEDGTVVSVKLKYNEGEFAKIETIMYKDSFNRIISRRFDSDRKEHKFIMNKETSNKEVSTFEDQAIFLMNDFKVDNNGMLLYES